MSHLASPRPAAAENVQDARPRYFARRTGTPVGERSDRKMDDNMPGLEPIDGGPRKSEGRNGNLPPQKARKTDGSVEAASTSKPRQEMPALIPIDGEARSTPNGSGTPPTRKKSPPVAIIPTGMQTDAFERRYNIQVAESGRYADHFLQITYTNCPSVAESFVRDHLRGCSKVGFDLEHKPTYRPGQKPNVSLLQFAPALPEHVKADRAHIPVLVYSIYHDRGMIPECLAEILGSPAIAKYGVGIKNDLRHLAYLNFPQPAREAYKELGLLAYKVGLVEKSGIGLKALVERCLGIECTSYKTKKLTMTNWEGNALKVAEIKYAAMDAWTAIECLDLIEYIDSTNPAGRDLS